MCDFLWCHTKLEARKSRVLFPNFKDDFAASKDRNSLRHCSYCHKILFTVHHYKIFHLPCLYSLLTYVRVGLPDKTSCSTQLETDRAEEAEYDWKGEVLVKFCEIHCLPSSTFAFILIYNHYWTLLDRASSRGHRRDWQGGPKLLGQEWCVQKVSKASASVRVLHM